MICSSISSTENDTISYFLSLCLFMETKVDSISWLLSITIDAFIYIQGKNTVECINLLENLTSISMDV